MSVFKCKICGGNLDVPEGATVVECEYCGTKQTLPKLDDDRRANLYDRANHFRRNNEFDKAMGIYEKILNEDKTDAEAYWSLVLCRYGIEYVEDPSSHKRVPTVNRAQYTSIFDDDNYKSALQYADTAQKEVYQAEARAINEIQKGILAISQKEEPFDVFICYKETDRDGRRTPDSVLANDLYHQLTQEGFKVFFSRITLEDKLGTAYEPYIFAALNSAKVMVALGTKPEYFNAIWVKNEWSRYLSLIKNGAQKVLIPAYRDMDPYDLPEEFSHLQAQDMSKLGFMQDLIRGIKKIIGEEEKPTVVKETVIASEAVTNYEPLLERAFMFLEDKSWAEADSYCEKVLDLNPKCAEAYLGKLMAGHHARRKEDLKNCELPFNNENNYQKILRFGDETLASTLEGYIKYINERNELARLERIYSNALKNMKGAKFESSFKAAAGDFRGISGYKDSAELSKKCLELAEVARKDKIYYDVEKMSFAGIADYEGAVASLKTIPGWKDANELVESYSQKIEELKKKAEEERIAAEKAKEEKGRKEREAKIAAERARKKRNKIMVIVVAVVILGAVGIGLINSFVMPDIKYKSAVKLMNGGKYTEAISAFEALDDYKDSNKKIIECKYNDAMALAKAGDTAKAAIAFVKIEDYSDAREQSLKLWEKCADRKTISAGNDHTVGLRSDGTVVATGDNYFGQCDVSDLKNIVAVFAGRYHTVGLHSDGTVVATGDNRFGQCDVSEWKNIVAISAVNNHTVGLRSDGTVVATGDNYFGQCDVSDWKDVVAVAAGVDHTIGLRSDGTAVAVGANNNGQCNVSEWKNIVAVAAGCWHTVGLRSDGTAVATGYNEDGRCDVSDWKNIVAVSAGGGHTIGLRSDGTAVATGYNEYGQCDVSDWKNIKLPQNAR